MASSNDVRDIMGLERSTPGNSEITKAMILGSDRPRKSHSKKDREPAPRRPEGMARELYNLLYNDNKDAPPIIPSDSASPADKGYKQLRAKLGMRKVRPWKWMAFTNPARRDGLVLYHWRRAADEGREYPFAKFNKRIELPVFNDIEYQTHLAVEGWTRGETDHLLDLCRRFDLRFTVIQDRWDRETFKTPRSIEDLKERYYGICEKLETVRPDPARLGKTFVYDADHEKRRKEQLRRLYDRTPEQVLIDGHDMYHYLICFVYTSSLLFPQVEEEEMLKAELRRIEARKKEREKKTQDLQKLIAQADSTGHKSEKKSGGSGGSHKKKSSGTSSSSSHGRSPAKEIGAIDGAGIKFPDLKTPGVALRSQRMKLPQSVGQKKTKAVEQMLSSIGLEVTPMPTADVAAEFNLLRNDMVLLYELKNALSACEVELQSLKAQYETLCPGKSLEIPDKLRPHPPPGVMPGLKEKTKCIADVIDVVGNGATPLVRKRKAALEQGNVLKKIKNKNF